MTHSMRAVAAVGVALILTACGNGDGPMSTDKGPRDLRPQHTVVVTPEAFANLSPEQRAKRERETADAIVERVPPQFRVQMRSMLEHPRPGRDVAFQSSPDPELARLLGELTSLRQVARANGQPHAAAVTQVEDTTIHVILALVPKLAPPGARATVILGPNGSRTPIVLLQENDATKDDMQLGIRAATVAFRRYGPIVATERRMSIRGKNRQPTKSAVSDPNLERLKRAALVDVPGVGKVRTLEVVTSLAAAR